MSSQTTQKVTPTHTLSLEQPPNTTILLANEEEEQEVWIMLPKSGDLWVFYEYGDQPALYVYLWHQGGRVEQITDHSPEIFKVNANDALVYKLASSKNSIKLCWSYDFDTISTQTTQKATSSNIKSGDEPPNTTRIITNNMDSENKVEIILPMSGRLWVAFGSVQPPLESYIWHQGGRIEPIEGVKTYQIGATDEIVYQLASPTIVKLGWAYN